jgi:hypothetical protein
MPFNGSGTFNRIYSWTVDAANNVTISSSRTDAEMNGFAAGLSNCITRDGQSPPSADLPMGGKKITGLGNATVSTDALNMATGDTRYLLANITSLTLTALTLTGSLTVGVNATITGNLSVTAAINPSSDIQFQNAGRGIYFKDASGGTPKLVSQNDNTLILSGTGSTGTARTIWSITMHSDTAPLVFAVPVQGITPTTADNSTLVATTAYVQANLANYATSATVDGLKDVPQNAQTAAYTLALTDRGKHISITTGGVVIPANASVAFPVGATVGIYNNSGSSQTISITTDTLTLAGTATTGTRTLAQHGFATILKVGTTNWIITGAGIT